ncbi:MAG: V-type ATP synthase subunit A, partial [Gammaproteobacteria bacterium]|nr:V-type ATP synthase subunit A [Gammaproteobacteria bacterium]
ADVPVAAGWWAQNINGAWEKRRTEALSLLARDAELSRIVNLVGPEALSHEQRWELEGASLIKEAVLQQSALDDADSYCSPRKQFELLELVMQVFDRGSELITLGAPVQELAEHPLMARIRRAKSSWRSEESEELAAFASEIYEVFATLRSEYASKQEASS